MLKKLIIIFILSLLFDAPVYSESYSKISVNGNKRISKESVIIFGKIDLNKDFNKNEFNNILKNLYETDFFKEVSVSGNNNTLVIELVENPIIEDIEIEGIKNEKLKEELLRVMSLSIRKSFKESLFKSDLVTIKNALRVNGYYFAEIKSSFASNELLNTTRINYNIDLGDVAKISDIQFVGDKKIKDKVLLNVIVSEIDRFWKFISRSVYLNSKTIELDRRLLKNYYKDNGYYNVEVNNSFVEIKNNNSFKLIYNINAGSKFKFNKLSLDLPTDFEPVYFEDVKETLLDLEGKTYSLNKINKVLKEIDKVALSKQYEFINADITESIATGNKIDITVSMKETPKFYVEKINISGNSITLEEVIRNTLIVDEGDPYNVLLFNKSINNVKSKGIFGSVKSKIIDGSDENLKIINIEVEEKPTGELSLGAGVGSSGGTIGGGIVEKNFLGKGIMLDTNINLTANAVKGKFSIIRPNFNYSDNTLYSTLRSDSVDNLTDFGYKTSDIGFSLATRYQHYQNLYFKPELDVEFEKLETESNASPQLKKQEGSYQDLYFNYFIDYDLRDKSYKPTDGYITTFAQKIPMISDNKELINTFVISKYQLLFSKMIGKVSFFGQTVNSLSDKDARISKRSNMPSTRLRGFEPGKVGPKDKGDFIGGNYVSSVNLATTLPQLLPSWDAADFSFFVDAGSVWGVDYDNSIKDEFELRSSTGITLDLISPVGPMNFTLSQPITKSSGDVTESFRFNIGTSF
ncbi:outer membrane protein assembly factor BamA [Candidatus Pelagibacter sp.]|nr:outer membrane protein assembly factor BamA [Candidatus Pelagibacter sp.]